MLKILKVTPLAGVWIEIIWMKSGQPLDGVTPLAGVWIEIDGIHRKRNRGWSLPSRECGLKFVLIQVVAAVFGHSPRGSVD